MKGIKPILLSELIIREPGGRKAGTVHAYIGEEENHMNADKAVLDIQRAVLMAEDAFFAALSKGDRRALESAVADDCILIDVLSGSEVPRAVFVEAVGLQLLTFESIERLGARVRLYGDTAVVTGHTRMIGRFTGRTFQVHSRYTHVYVHARDGFRLVNAQGTPVAPASGRP